MSAPYPDWIAVDWGTTHLRAWAMGPGGVVLHSAASDDGMARLSPDQFEPALLALIGPWLRAGHVTEVLACGMVGSRQGWHEAPYRAVPCAPLEQGTLARPVVKDPRLNVRITPGLKQTSPADVMRGEETQIAGFLADTPNFDGVLCLPGTHTKWAQISAGEAVSFQTFMTGEMFALLSDHSVLRHSVSGAGGDTDLDTGAHNAAFLDALSDAMSRPEKLAARLFGLRAQSLLSDLPPGIVRARLSGQLIGIELAAAKPYWLGQDVVVLGSEAMGQAYIAALTAQGLTPRRACAESAVRAGLASVRAGAMV